MDSVRLVGARSPWGKRSTVLRIQNGLILFSQQKTYFATVHELQAIPCSHQQGPKDRIYSFQIQSLFLSYAPAFTTPCGQCVSLTHCIAFSTRGPCPSITLPEKNKTYIYKTTHYLKSVPWTRKNITAFLPSRNWTSKLSDPCSVSTEHPTTLHLLHCYLFDPKSHYLCLPKLLPWFHYWPTQLPGSQRAL